jgi:hypothetical protein
VPSPYFLIAVKPICHFIQAPEIIVLRLAAISKNSIQGFWVARQAMWCKIYAHHLLKVKTAHPQRRV